MNKRSKRLMLIGTVILYMILVYVVIFSFSLYYENSKSVKCINDNEVNITNLGKSDYFHFSAVTYFTIGYGDFLPTEHGRKIVVFQSVLSLICNSVFTGFFLYLLFRRSHDLMLSNRLFIGKRNYSNEKIFLRIKIGNRGRQLIDIKRTIEVFEYVNGKRRRIFNFDRDYQLLDRVLIWDLNLGLENKKKLALALLESNDNPITVRVIVRGNDIQTGDNVVAIREYESNDILFIDSFQEVYTYEYSSVKRSMVRTKELWHKFDWVNLISDKEKEDIERRLSEIVYEHNLQ